MLYYYNIFLLLVQEISCYCCVLNNQSTQEKLFVSSVRWHFFVFRNSVEKFCVLWAFPLIECVAEWALKLPVVSAPLRSLHNRSPPDFCYATHTDVLKTHESQSFSTKLRESKGTGSKHLSPHHSRLSFSLPYNRIY